MGRDSVELWCELLVHLLLQSIGDRPCPAPEKIGDNADSPSLSNHVEHCGEASVAHDDHGRGDEEGHKKGRQHKLRRQTTFDGPHCHNVTTDGLYIDEEQVTIGKLHTRSTLHPQLNTNSKQE